MTDIDTDRANKIPAMVRDECLWLAAQLAKVTAERDRLGKIADELLNHCDKEGGECSECAKIVCPQKDPYHFHHDGCPSCAEIDVTEATK